MSIRRGLMSQMASEKCRLLSTVNAVVGEKKCVIPLNNSWFENYSMLILVCDIKFVDTPSVSEWFYVTFNTTDYVSNRYQGVSDEVKANGRIMCIIGSTISEDKIQSARPSNILQYNEYQINDTNNYFTVSLWTNTFIDGSNVKVYGLN